MPEQPIDYASQVEITSARRWTTDIPLDKYRLVSGKESYPDFLKKDIVDDTLRVYSNGEINYRLNGVNVRVSVIWNFMAEVENEGTGDTHYSVVKGSKADVMIRQGAEQGYKPMLYVACKTDDTAAFEKELRAALASIADRYPGLDIEPSGEKEWHVIVPDALVKTHETRFSSVMKVYLQYLIDGKIPDWEVSQMKAKYYTTTAALEAARAAK